MSKQFKKYLTLTIVNKNGRHVISRTEKRVKHIVLVYNFLTGANLTWGRFCLLPTRAGTTGAGRVLGPHRPASLQTVEEVKPQFNGTMIVFERRLVP